MSIKQRILDYLANKTIIDEAEAKNRDIRQYFADNLATILEARGLAADEPLLEELDLTSNGKVCEKTRETKRCDFATLKERYPEVYDEVVTEGSTTYVEIRKVAR